jgi:Protein of unknown function (DUF3987)
MSEYVTLDEARRHRVDFAREDRTEPPRPLTRDLPPPELFPVNALGTLLEAAATAIHDRVQAPLAIGAQSVLAVATLAAQAHADVGLPTGQQKPLSCFFLSVAGTGDRKTSADAEAAWAVRKRESVLRELHAAERPDFENAKAVWEKARENVLKKKEKPHELKLLLDQLGPPPSAPLEPLLTCPEPTYEGLSKHFAVGLPSVGIFTTEGGQFLGGHGMSSEAKVRTAAGMSALWDGEPIKRVRAVDGTRIMPGRRLSMHLMAQPDIAAIALGDPLLADQGLLSRFLVAAPASLAGTRLWHEPAPESEKALKRYGGKILDLLEAPFPLANGTQNELEPRLLTMSPRARQLWTGFADHVEKLIGIGGELEPVRGLANKLPEHAARIAGVLTLLDDLYAREIGANAMAAGIEIAQHYASEALRLFGTSRIDPELVLAQKLLAWLQRWPERAISLPDIYQRGLNAIGDKATAKRLVRILEDHGWLRRLQGIVIVAGNRRRETWEIIRG